ncbi:MAG: riboflavin synthase [Nevskiaceae bacterium]|nr:MAG: riboflavin synthase [Nevskiaceae bacterium]TBR74734.1 MAG: riboflavin synthase [Nevskiaceae bacterium]
MFTGIVAAQGCINEVTETAGDRRFTIVTKDDCLDALVLGDSIAVSGVCLTAVARVPHGFVTDVSVETLQLTTAGHWQAGQVVNLETATTPATALGGHLVLGHVDGRARLVDLHEDARSHRLRFEAPAALARYVARKGSITLDGVSLTVNTVEGTRFGVNIIPLTYAHTTLGTLRSGDEVNLEVDVVARYVERLLQAGQ